MGMGGFGGLVVRWDFADSWCCVKVTESKADDRFDAGVVV